MLSIDSMEERIAFFRLKSTNYISNVDNNWSQKLWADPSEKIKDKIELQRIVLFVSGTRLDICGELSDY